MTDMTSARRPALLRVAIALALGLTPTLVLAQNMDHSAHGAHKPVPEPDHEEHEDGQPAEQAGHDHSTMEHASEPSATPLPSEADVDHAAMGHRPAAATEEPDVDHAVMGHDMSTQEQPPGMDHSAMGHGAHAGSGDLPATAAPREPIPEITEADRVAAFPDVAGHAVHDNAVHWFVLLDRLETWDEDDASPIAWEGSGWIGTDLDRAWVRSEGEAVDGTVESANVELFYGRAVARWWDAVVGVRHDFGDGPSRTFAAIGVMGLAPYMFEVEATAYLGESGQTGLGLEAEYETLFTNRLILQSVIEAEAWGKDDPARGIGSGLSKVEAGFRLRYEFTRRFAPYVGIVRERVFGQTADFRETNGGEVDDTRFVLGLRTWF